MPQPAAETARSIRSRIASAGSRPEMLLAGITLAAILLLVATGSTWLSSFLELGMASSHSQQLLASTLLLNIAIILLGWRRFRELDAEVCRRRAAEEHATALASNDPLTGLLNRRAFAIETSAALASWSDEGRGAAALVVDIDAFKSINDLFGHAGGDAVLLATAGRLKAAAPPSAILARLGGDEFAIFFPVEPDDGAMADAIGSAIAQLLSEPVVIDGVAASTSASIGGAVASHGPTDADVLLRHADTAMYRAKRLGRCRYCRFDDAMEIELARRDIVERELKIAIDRNQLYPVYEPLIDLSTGEAVGYEMLARWISPTLGEVGPSEFIPVAEDKGLISLLSDHLFRKALCEARSWPVHLSLSLNVSPLQLRDPWFAQKLLRLLAETGFPGQRLIVEITESAIVDNLPLAQAVFESLRNQGIRMALDDFGTGYSSIASLRALPFDSVKIDREYVQQMTDISGPDSVAEAVLQLGRSLGLPVVAEGIECGDTAQRLTDLDCAVGQGYLYGHSLTSDDVVARHRAGGGHRKAM
jgi:diguanylate cyclase (GGDEF)-like protein